MATPDDLRALAVELAAGRTLPADEATRRLAEACDLEYWRTLSPSIQISTADAIDQLPISQGELRGIGEQFAEERYFSCRPFYRQRLSPE